MSGQPADVSTVIPAGGALPLAPHLEDLVETARSYAKASRSKNTQHAYDADWKHFGAWCRRMGVDPLPPVPQTIGLYISALAHGDQRRKTPALSVATIERRLSGLSWHFAQRGQPLDRKDRHIATVLAGIRRSHARPPQGKDALMGADIIAMTDTLGRDLRGLRDRAILLIGFAGGLRRSEIVALDVEREDSSTGWIEIVPEAGLILRLRGKTGWREVEIGRGSSEASCPLTAVETWIHYAKIARGPLFRRIFKDGTRVDVERLSDRHVARLVKRTALDAGIRADLPEAERQKLFSGHSLRAGLASSAEIEERYVQRQLGHASAEMTRKYQRRRDRFRVNLTKAAGL
ncbi:tyrosine-type recombinase/integrase [Martelella sp. HB161492]|uniref:tyrosine-type recombinase/integrase n=1 Tax=Martelella sp. HB161492 TaxID=2720726 RepID=UPI0032B0F723